MLLEEGRADAPASAAGWRAHLELGFANPTGQRTLLADRRHYGPLRVQKPLYPEGPGICHAIIVHPPGGIVGGDRLEMDLRLGRDARVLVTTPGATKWYRAPDLPSFQQTRIWLDAGATLEWLPQEAIVYDHANASSDVAVDLGSDALFVGWDILCFGRTASGESFAGGAYRQRWRIRQGGTLLWNEVGELRGGSPLMSSPLGLGGAPVCASFVAAGRTIPSPLIDAVRARIDEFPCAGRLAATRLPALLAARYVGPSAEEARAAFVAIWEILRPALTGIKAHIPRLWRT